MKQTRMLLSLVAALAFSAAAQTYSQPVRDADNGARSGVYGTCGLSAPAGYSGSGLQNCSMMTVSGLNLSGTVPDGKILIFEEAAATCHKNSADALSRLIISSPNGQRLLPLSLQGARGSTQAWVSHTTGRLYVAPNRLVKAQLDTLSNLQYNAYCTVYFSGYLVDAQ